MALVAMNTVYDQGVSMSLLDIRFCVINLETTLAEPDFVRCLLTCLNAKAANHVDFPNCGCFELM